MGLAKLVNWTYKTTTISTMKYHFVSSRVVIRKKKPWVSVPKNLSAYRNTTFLEKYCIINLLISSRYNSGKKVTALPTFRRPCDLPINFRGCTTHPSQTHDDNIIIIIIINIIVITIIIIIIPIITQLFGMDCKCQICTFS